jgi:hypothetical protein
MVEALHGNTKGKMVETPVVEQVSSIPASSAKDNELLDPEDGNAEMDLEK